MVQTVPETKVESVNRKSIGCHNTPINKGDLGREIAASLEGITREKVIETCFANAEANSSFIAAGKNITELQTSSLLEGETALVIAAGPSLHRDKTADIIKRSGFQGVIVATDSSMSWCLRNEITPHLVVTLDPHGHRIVRWFGDPSLDSNVLKNDDYFVRQDMDPDFGKDQLKANEALLRLVDSHAPNIRIAVASSASQSVVQRVIKSGMEVYWWNPMYDDYEQEKSFTRKIHTLNGLPCINAGGNVGSACWVFAHAVLQKKRVGLVGMDFSYYAETPYNKTQYYHEILDLVGQDGLGDVFISMVNPHLEKEFYTDPAYLWYRNAFLEMAEQADCQTYNCTGGGILFGASVHWVSLSEFLCGAIS